MARGTTGTSAVQRTAASRCAVCNQRLTDVYLCELCARRSTFLRRDDARSVTATTVSKAMCVALGRDIEVQQLSSIQSIRYRDADDDTGDVDANGDPTFSPSNHKTRRLLFFNHLPHFTRQELTRWNEILNELVPIRGSLARAIARNRSRGARRRWTRFSDFWSILALHIFTENIKLPVRSRRRLSPELLARIL